MVIVPEHVAQWMFDELVRTKYLSQDIAVSDILEKFGGQFTYENNNGSLAIDKKVLTAFRKLTGDRVVWDRGERLWRFRETYDEAGRQQ